MPSTPLPFVVHHHTTPADSDLPDHFDIMFLRGEVLATWACPRPPEQWIGEVKVHQLGDHRRGYLQYEGPLSKNRGDVRLHDRGAYETGVWTDELVEIVLEGGKARGRLMLRPTTEVTLRGPVWIARFERTGAP